MRKMSTQSAVVSEWTKKIKLPKRPLPNEILRTQKAQNPTNICSILFIILFLVLHFVSCCEPEKDLHTTLNCFIYFIYFFFIVHQLVLFFFFQRHAWNNKTTTRIYKDFAVELYFACIAEIYVSFFLKSSTKKKKKNTNLMCLSSSCACHDWRQRAAKNVSKKSCRWKSIFKVHRLMRWRRLL